ncbi:MAG: hypothetical protein A3H02_02920 [Candidatus Niyogibacteria bacterium RIFCSPLOWO2_12_FULL_41_13]|uniref:Uncharacterized protein n=2 Tax=Parcubacteria group TaxID=1794811 RepID=A0A1G1Z482_9BACT|nr:MAG: hypothetical protein A3F24_00865 [Candidatus Colwellbacteria bacterium RIFCSPHIGHO2_12_FULL_44_17]OGZ32029.1 MAG: hypothetical protein A3H02_02920 [Candidatus Niyogibacteria bacterium RIFCSPLOWO2_12_FULL_41_13]
MARQIIKKQAIRLRKGGYSYNYIKEKLSVSKGTLSYWLRDVPYSPNEEIIRRIGLGRLKMAIFKSRQKMDSIEKAQGEAVKEIGNLTKRDLLMLGIGLYMGEGSKTTGVIRIINSNSEILSFAINWFKKACGLTTKNFSLAIHLYPDNNIKKCLRHWSRLTGIPLKQFGKTQIDGRMDKKLFKRGKLPFGTAHLTIRSNNSPEYGIFLFRKIMAWMEVAMKQAGMV